MIIYKPSTFSGCHHCCGPSKADDPPVMKRKVVRGGSWKDVSYYLQVTTRDYQYQDSANCYTGFRCIQPYLGRNKGDNPRMSRVYR